MARKSGLTRAAVQIGGAIGRAEGRARRMKKEAQQSLKKLDKQLTALRKEFDRTQKRLRKALAAARP